MVKGKAKGSAYELAIAKKFQERGFKAVTSRSESRNRDNQKVDLIGTSWVNVQCKAVERFGRHHETLKEMPSEIDRVNAVFHKRNNKGSTVTITEKDFWILFDKIESHTFNGIVRKVHTILENE